jgi:hypothetical protein
MNVEQIVKQYPLLFDFLNQFFHESAYEEFPSADNATHLVEEAIASLFQEGLHTTDVKELAKEMYFFIHTPLYEGIKEEALQEVLKVELMGLKPVEFVRYLSYTLTIEQWKTK